VNPRRADSDAVIGRSLSSPGSQGALFVIGREGLSQKGYRKGPGDSPPPKKKKKKKKKTKQKKKKKNEKKTKEKPLLWGDFILTPGRGHSGKLREWGTELTYCLRGRAGGLTYRKSGENRWNEKERPLLERWRKNTANLVHGGASFCRRRLLAHLEQPGMEPLIEKGLFPDPYLGVGVTQQFGVQITRRGAGNVMLYRPWSEY